MLQVSIIIPVKNGGALLKKVLSIVNSQKVPFNYEVIIIDSGSTDGSLEYLQELTSKEPRCKLYIIQPKDFGHGKTRNYGVLKARGKYVVFLTQDALPSNDKWLEKLLSPFKENNKKIVGVFGKHIPHEDAWPFEKSLIKEHFEKLGNDRIFYEIDDWEEYKNKLGWYVFYSDNNSCMRKDILEKIPFREVDMGEDQWWAKDILEAGYCKAYEPSACVYHSHNYGFKNAFLRSLAEYKLYLEIGILSPTGIKRAVMHYVRLTIRSTRICKNAQIPLISKLKFTVFYFFRNIFSTMGFYMGLTTNTK